MRFLFVSRRGASLSLATRIVHEGHKVHFFVNNLLYKVLGKGIIDKAKISEFHNCDIIIFDEAGMGEYASKMAKTKPVIGSSIFADTFNNDTEYKEKVLNKCGLSIAEGYHPKHRTLESVQSAEEIYVTGWFNGFNFVRPMHSYFKKTKLMENDLGIETESMGGLLWYHKANKITKSTLHMLIRELKKTGYIGAVNIRLSVTEDNLYIKDVYLGFSYDNTYMALEGIRQDYGEMFYRLAFDGIKRIKASPDWLTATRVTVPPYPLQMNDKLNKPTLIKGINESNLKHLWLRDVYMEDNEYYSAGCDGFVLTVSARGLTPRKAIRRTHRTINNLTINNVQYRRDVIEGFEERYDRIKKWGYF